MRRSVVAAILLSLFAISTGRVEARGVTGAYLPDRSHVVVATFRLHISGRPSPGTTFWVAYGPLAGKFGLVRLSDAGSGLRVATQALPGTGRTVFAYLAGHGVTMTRHGPAPGNPVVVIRTIGPISPAHLPPLVQWSAPAG